MPISIHTLVLDSGDKITLRTLPLQRQDLLLNKLIRIAGPSGAPFLIRLIADQMKGQKDAKPTKLADLNVNFEALADKAGPAIREIWASLTTEEQSSIRDELLYAVTFKPAAGPEERPLIIEEDLPDLWTLYRLEWLALKANYGNFSRALGLTSVTKPTAKSPSPSAA